jgi:DNA invertase Pin-like site-specific DNA recombinase
MQRTAIYLTKTIDAQRLIQVVEERGGKLVGVYGGGRHQRGWKNLRDHLDAVDTVVVEAVSDLPVRSVHEFLSALARLHEAGVSLYVTSTNIDTLTSPATALLDLMIGFKNAKRSQAIRLGQERAAAAGKTIGRPKLGVKLGQRIAAAVAAGGGIRPTARKFGVSPATVINLTRSPQPAIVPAA